LCGCIREQTERHWRELAEQTPGWAEELLLSDPQVPLRFFRLQRNPPELAQEVVRLLEARLEQAETEWRQDRLGELLQPYLQALHAEVRQLLQELPVALSPDPANGFAPEAAATLTQEVERVAASRFEEFLGTLSREAPLSGQLLAGAAAGAMIGTMLLGSLGTLLGGVFGGILAGGLANTEGSMLAMVKHVGDQLARRLREAAPRAARELAGSVEERLQPVLTATAANLEREQQQARAGIERLLALPLEEERQHRQLCDELVVLENELRRQQDELRRLLGDFSLEAMDEHANR
jgi:hypothetical protein